MPNAIRFHKSGGPEVLVWEPVPIGKPGPGEARVRHTAVGVNFVDIYIRTGLYPAALPSGLGTEAAGICDAIRRLDVVDARADLLNDAGGLGTKAAGQRRGIEARADVDVHEVHTDGRVAHARLAGAWLANRDWLPHQHFRPAGLMETDSVGHFAAPLGHERPSMINRSQTWK